VATPQIDKLVTSLRSTISSTSIILEAHERSAYSCDGLTSHRAVPELVIVPDTRDELVTAVRAVIDAGLPWVARGAGTGLSGGALPDEEGVLVVTARLNHILEVDAFAHKEREKKSKSKK
jgi:glycolate oxidase